MELKRTEDLDSINISTAIFETRILIDFGNYVRVLAG